MVGFDWARRACLVILSGASLLSADTLVLRNGSSVDGSFVGGDNRTLRFLVGNQVSSYNLTDVVSINFGGSGMSAAPGPNTGNAVPAYGTTPAYGTPVPPANSSATNGYGTAGRTDVAVQDDAPPAPAPPSGTGGMAIPAGSAVIVRLIDGANSDTDRMGQTYRASIDEPVVVNGYTVIGRGADCVVSLVAAQQSGRIEGQSSLTLALRSVSVNGRTYNVTTTPVVQAAASRTKRSAGVIGGTAALGAIIGAIAGGGSGAAIGAVSGGAVGAAAQVYTGGSKVKVPSETRLSFTLQNPVNL